ncbi:MAG TPA: DEAD/DEAH box helicase [Actinomycetota bacterium]|jgi:ATP-dependent Lhr-like helicase|nr:DEAD/DEAH box helicase [Actinomycetota bacterium]
MASRSAISLFSETTRSWFNSSFSEPTAAQEGTWASVAKGRDTLVVAPTGSGKTLAAFLWALDRIATSPEPPAKERLRVLYVSPLKALAVDVERNLNSPVNGIARAAERLGLPVPRITFGIRTGDTPQEQRRKFPSNPPDILITTPESLFLLLTSQARDALKFIDTVIVDEVHAVAATKRGAHLALSLERLDALLTEPAQRIGLSATVRPLAEVAKFLGGTREVHIVNPPSNKQFDLSVVVPIEDMGELGEEINEIAEGSAVRDPDHKTIWPSIEARLVELIQAHHSTIVFVNSRRLSERVCAQLNELAGEQIARAHHGSVSKEQRKLIEEDLKMGVLKAVVATSSLELGIDMGAVDLVLQVEAPTSVSSGLQRVGRAGHQVGAVSRGVILPKWRGDLVESAVVVERMKTGEIEALRYPRNPLDVLAQHIVSMVAMEDWALEEAEALVRRAAPFEGLPTSALVGVLDMLSGLYPSDEFAELRPRINWDRFTGVLSARGNARLLAVTSGGTIPDRGLFGVYLAGGEGNKRVGELDEEMVYESRHGDVFTLGASNWRIEQITHDRVLVTPAPGAPAKMPFWHGDALGRPVELGRALGKFMREVGHAPAGEAYARLRAGGLDDFAANNLIKYLAEQIEATGHLPTDRTIVVERFRDELGDWRLCVHSPFGARVHAPWALAIENQIRSRLGVEVQTMHTDDGIVVRLPEADDAPALESILFEPDDIEALVTAEVGGSAMFASRFRECAARALLLPKRRPGKRTPLWQQRQKSANLLQVASGYGSFPIVLETMRECLQDVFDLPGLTQLMTDIRSAKVRTVQVDTEHASPFASSLLFGYIGAFIYDGDAPLAERRAQALSLDTALLAELLGSSELRELIDPEALAEIELELQRLADTRKIRNADETHDALRMLGDLSEQELYDRGARSEWLAELQESRRALMLRIAGEMRWVAIEDAGRFRDALGTALPMGIPDAFLKPVNDPMGDLIGRYARSHGPFQAPDPAARFGLGTAVVTETLNRLESKGRMVRGEFRPGGAGTEWCDAEVLRSIRRRSLAKLRKEVEAASPEVLGRFLPVWHGIGEVRTLGGLNGLIRAIEQIQGAAVPASALERLVLPARVPNYNASMLDELTSAGEVLWAGAGAIGSDDGWVSLYLPGHAELLMPAPAIEDLSEEAHRVLEALSGGGAMFFRQLTGASGIASDTVLLDALWELAWAGLATNDTIAPLRALKGVGRSTPSLRPGRRLRRGPALPVRQGPPSGVGRWSLLPERSHDPTRRMSALADQLLDRHGVLTRGAVVSESIPGNFSAVYPVLKAMEEAGHCRRGYFVEKLGAAQFAMPGAVDRMRSLVAGNAEPTGAIVLAATDPANPFGAALPWPDRPAAGDAPTKGHRPGRKAGALVVMVEGSLVLYVEKGGRTVLTYSAEPTVLQPAVDALALAVRQGALGKLAVEKADGAAVEDSPVARAMEEAGFRHTPKGLRLRA